jgi:hypothetical protein
MRAKRNLLAVVGGACLVIVAGLVLARSISPPLSVRAATNINPPPFDFSDSFYIQNGIKLQPFEDPNGGARVGFSFQFGPEFGNPTPPNVHNWIPDDSNTDPTRSNIRVTQTTGGFDKDGNLIYYDIYGTVNDQTFFTQDAAGQRAHTLANQFRAFLFPKQFVDGSLTFIACSPTVTTNCFKPAPPPPNRRQDNVFDTKNEYFCQNLLGLWVLTFVVYTPKAFNTAAGQQALTALAARNGISLDGTPVLERVAEIDGLTDQGFLRQITMPEEPHAGTPRWVV